MAFKCVSGDSSSVPMYCGTSSSITAGAVVCFDASTGAAVSPVIDATSSLLSEDLAGVVMNTPASGDSYADVIPIRGQLWEYDCTSNTAATMLGKKNDLTDSTTVANSTTISTANTAFVTNISLVGATGNKKMRGFIVPAYDTGIA